MRLRLSEAIRLGALLHPQCYGEFARLDDSLQHLSTCALGAAGEAIGSGFEDIEQVVAIWPWLDAITFCPLNDVACRRGPDYVKNLITHLNDDHRWTRERIARWVETIEPADPVAGLPLATAEGTDMDALDPVDGVVA